MYRTVAKLESILQCGEGTYLQKNILLILGGNAGWCAKYYEGSDFNGEEVVVGEISHEIPTNKNDKTSSVRVKPGCTLKLFENSNNVGLLDTLTSDASFLSDRSRNKISSLSCTCKGMIFLMSLFESMHCVLEHSVLERI